MRQNSSRNLGASACRVEALEARRLLHGGLDLAVSFQPAGSAAPAGFVTDVGRAFSFRSDSGHRYGWSLNGVAWHNSWTSRRNTPADEATDSFVALGHRGGLAWELAVAAGRYRVTVGVGDVMYRQDESHRIAVEGSVAVEHTASPGEPGTVGIIEVEVTDGRLTITAPDGVANSKLAWVRIVSIDDDDDDGGGGGGGGGGEQTPWGDVPVSVPARVEAEWFDRGGQDVAFFDTDPDENRGGAFRDDGPDIVERDGEVIVGWTRDGEWLEYTISNESAGEFDLSIRAGSDQDGGRILFSIDGESVGSPITLAGGFPFFRNYSAGTFDLPAGTHVLGMSFEGEGNADVADVDWIELTAHDDSGGTITLGPWETQPAMPNASFEGASAVIDGIIYIWGGYDTPNVWRSRTRGQAFNTATNSWSQVADLPEALTHMQAVPFSGKIYIFGGYVNTDTASGARDDVWAYDPATNSFSHVSDMPFAIGGHGVTMIGSRAYVVSGMFRQGRNFLSGSRNMFSIDLANPGAGWRTEPDTPVSRDHFNAVTVDGKIYMVSGQLDDAEYTGNRPEVYRFDPADSSWTRVADLPAGRGHIDQSTLAWNGRIFVFAGGKNGDPGENYATEVFMYDVATDSWSLLGHVPAPRLGGAAEIVGEYVYIVGGGDGIPRADVWRARLIVS